MTDPLPPCRTRFPGLIDRAFVHGLSRWRRRRLRRHLATCAACRRSYDRLEIVERQLGGDREPLSAATVDELGATVVGLATRSTGRRMMWAGIAATATASAIAFVLVPRADAPGELRPRGTGVVAGERFPGARIFCIVGAAGQARVVAERRLESGRMSPPLRCPLDAEIQLAYSTPDAEGLTMVAFSRKETSLLILAPRWGDENAVPLAADRVDESLGWSTRLAVNHTVGSYEVVVRIFDRPVLARAAIEGTVRPISELRGRLELLAPGSSLDVH